MNCNLAVRRSVSRAIWLSELAAALNAADRLANCLSDIRRGGTDLIDVRAQIDAISREVEQLRLGHIGHVDVSPPKRMN